MHNIRLADVRIRWGQVEDCPALGQVLVSSNNSAFRGRVPDHCLAFTAEESANNWTRNFKADDRLNEETNLLVAEISNQNVVGLAMYGSARQSDGTDNRIPEIYTHELMVLSVAPEWQRGGIGRKLVNSVASNLWRSEESALLLRVLTINPNVGFYKRLGAVKLGTEPFDWDGFELKCRFMVGRIFND